MVSGRRKFVLKQNDQDHEHLSKFRSSQRPSRDMDCPVRLNSRVGCILFSNTGDKRSQERRAPHDNSMLYSVYFYPALSFYRFFPGGWSNIYMDGIDRTSGSIPDRPTILQDDDWESEFPEFFQESDPPDTSFADGVFFGA